MTLRLVPHASHSSCSFAYQRWGQGNAKKILCFHGWLDNSSSFAYLGPKLAERGYDVVAVDHQGHGRSSHLGPSTGSGMGASSASYQFTHGVQTIKFVIDALARDQEKEKKEKEKENSSSSEVIIDSSLNPPPPHPLTLGHEWQCPYAVIGHSMSAAMTMLFAASFPENLNRLVLIEGFGPLTSAPYKAARTLRAAILAEDKYRHAMETPAKIYPTLSLAIEARCDITKIYPGKQSLSREAAAALIGRGVRLADLSKDLTKMPPATDYAVEDTVPDLIEGRDDIDSNGTALPVRFRYDHRLTLPSHMYMTTEQVEALTDNIACPTLLITAHNGWPPQSKEEMEKRIAILSNKGLLRHEQVPGSHHCHLDPGDREMVFDRIDSFLTDSTPVPLPVSPYKVEGLLEGTVARAKHDALHARAAAKAEAGTEAEGEEEKMKGIAA